MQKRFEASFDLHPDHCPEVLGIVLDPAYLVTLSCYGASNWVNIHGMNRPECEAVIKACESRIKYLEARNESHDD
jgi:hypothetical protein